MIKRANKYNGSKNVPDGWAVRELGDLLVKLSNGLTYDTSETVGLPVTRIETISSGVIDLSRVGHVSCDRDIDHYRMEKGDLLFSHINSLLQIGKVAYYDSDGVLYHGMNLLLLRCDKSICSKYLYYLLMTPYMKCVFRSIAKPAVNQASISTSDLKRVNVILPNLCEQEKIVNCIELWDLAIEKQSALIEKLRLRKRALMRQLLTGKKRLPGFTDKWKTVKLGEVAERVTRKNEENNQNVVTISAQHGFISQTEFFNKSIASETLDGYFLVKKDEFCYNKSYSNGYPMGVIKRLKTFDKAVVTTLYICFRLKNCIRIDIDFFEQYCESGILNRELVKVANEGGRAHGLLNVTPSDFFNMHTTMPGIEEQQSIASVLINADKEIGLARSTLAAMQSQKRGLMQQLLTGKKRIK